MTAVSPEIDISKVMQPTGYRILVRIPPLKEGLVVLPAAARKAEEIASCKAVVLAIGNLAYQDENKFPFKIPWCQVGDTVIIRQYSGTRITIDGQEHRLINDDTVEAVVHQPERVERV